MESEDSRPGSSASNSSSNSSQISEQSPHNFNDQKHEIQSQSADVSPASSSRSRRSRQSGSAYGGSQHSHSKSKSDSDSSSNTSLSDEDEDEETKSSNNANLEKKSNSACSEINGTENKRHLSTTSSPTSRRSSRESSLSSNRSRSISGERHQENNELTITHEDLSDVSDLESEKRTSLYKNISVKDENVIVEKGIATIDEYRENENDITDLRQKLEKKKYQLNKNMRVSNQQKEKLVDYMSANLEFARGQFGGINSNVNAKEQWEQLQKTLNALGGSAKSIEQWKKCWADLKAGVKKHANVRRAIMNRTGGGSWSEVPRELNSLEEKILSIMTTDAIDGDSRTIESGFEAVIPEELDGSPPRDDDKIIVKDKTEESLEDLVKPHDEDALDFEAEEGECHEPSKNDGKHDSEKENNVTDEQNNLTKNFNNDKKEDEELEEGEVSDEDEKRPEETEPKPVCRFYTRGQCTWGMSCRFLHPGVTDKGNYTMFDLVRPVPLPPSGNSVGNRASNYPIHAADFHEYRSERPAIHHRNSSIHHTSGYPANHESRKVTLEGPVVVESAWERGLRTAKEMMRKANKRKEQDMDFEDKKMNLTLSPDELEKDPYYLKDRLSPAEVTRHHPLYEPATDIYNTADRYGRGPPIPHYDEIDPYGRSTRYRELPPHRMPQYEDERRVRPAREVIVQRVEPLGRSDDWNDPWMRSKSPNGRGGSREHGDKRRRERRSYSSNSSYTTSSSSQSDSSSDSSRSLSPRDRHRRTYNSSSHKVSPSVSRRASGRNLRSITPPPRKPRGTSNLRQSPTIKRRTNISSPVYNRASAYSPLHKRKRLSPLQKKIRSDKSKMKRRHSSSSSDSDSTGSDSESDSASSSSESSSQSQEHTPPTKRLRIADRLASNERKGPKKDLPKKRSPISIELKKPTTVGVSALTSPTYPVAPEKDSKKSRREELLKQLRAVEDAIAKKRSKLA